MALLTELAARAARALGEYDADILEAHHRSKRDAPSGTALALAQRAACGADRRRQSERPRRVPVAIGFVVVRGGDLVGEHTVLLSGPGEQLSLAHRANDRAIFARGALKAALWLASPAAGALRHAGFSCYKTGA